MPVSEAAVARLMAPLEAVREITSKKMFGGVGIYCDGVFFAIIDDDRLYFKFNESNAADFDAFDSDQWVIAGDNPSPMPYREIPGEVLGDSERLGAWIDKAVAVALAKKSKSKKKV